MEIFDNLILGLEQVLTPTNLALLFVGVIIGMVVGVMPGWDRRRGSPSCCR